MSVEAAIFILRLLAALSLIGFLALLFAAVWRSMRQIDQQLAAARTAYGYLTMQSRDRSKPPGTAQRYPLHAITTLGRSASSTIVVNDEFASSIHARIILEADQWWLEDRRSRNGTRLNDAAIEQRTLLADGDVIGIGKICYQLSLDAVSES
ncbi:MAG: FHA domain-containing protein [Chloroflexota bacterium]|nr:FHA domain-containing protein [Chloroflexota bacterium]MDE2908010.1 FHA domain-containing protein [Chloroflexota bacterium]